MSKTEYTTIGGGLIQYDKLSLRRYFHQLQGTATKKRNTYSREDLKNLPSLSKMSEAADAWNLLDAGTKNDWETAGIVCGLSGYNLFLQDKIYRIINEIAGNATPSIYHQYLIGHINIPESAGNFLFRQTRNEMFTFPVLLKICRKAELISENGGSEYLKVRFNYYYDEGAGELKQTNEINLALSSSWDIQDLSIIEHTGLTGLWELEIEGDLIHGDFYFDNFYVEAVEGIITKDSSCEKMNTYFRGLVLPEGITNGSIYPQD